MEGTGDRPVRKSRLPERWLHPKGWRRVVVAAGLVGLVGMYGLGFWGYINHGPPPPELEDQFGILRSDGNLAVFTCVGAPSDGVHEVELSGATRDVTWRAVLDGGSAKDVVPIVSSVPGYLIEEDEDWKPTGVVQTRTFQGERGSFSWYVEKFDTERIDDGTALTADGEIHTLTELASRFPACDLPITAG